MHLRGKLICEVAELAAFEGASDSDIKAFLTCEEDIFRLPHAQHDNESTSAGSLWMTANEIPVHQRPDRR